MGGPIDFLVDKYHQYVEPVVDDVVGFGNDLGEVGGALIEGVGDVVDDIREEGPLNVAVDLFDYTVDQGGEVLKHIRDDSPGEFVDWLTGPEGPSVAGFTEQIPGLQREIGEFLDTSMENPMVAGAVGKVFGFEYVPDLDIYTTNEGSIQSYFGFHDLYDKCGKAMGMDLEDKVVEFEVDGIEYRVELWQGSYGAGGAYGGEIGFYTRGTGERGWLGDLLEHIPGYYSSAAGDDQIRMSQTIYDTKTGEPYFTNDGRGADDGEHYWNLGIRTDPGVSHEDIGQRGELTLDDPAVARAMYDAMRADDGLKNVMISEGEDGSWTVSYDWRGESG